MTKCQLWPTSTKKSQKNIRCFYEKNAGTFVAQDPEKVATSNLQSNLRTKKIEARNSQASP